MIKVLAAAVDPDSAEPVVRLMSPTSVAVLLLVALVVDYLTVGPPWLRDRIAFLIAVVAIREGFNGSPLDAWTFGALQNAVQQLLDAAGPAYIAGAAARVVLGVIVACVAIYAIGQLMPTKFSKRLGRFAALKFKTSPTHRLNGQIWVMAILLGLLLDLPGGRTGDALRWLYELDLRLFAPLPNFLFGTETV